MLNFFVSLFGCRKFIRRERIFLRDFKALGTTIKDAMLGAGDAIAGFVSRSAGLFAGWVQSAISAASSVASAIAGASRATAGTKTSGDAGTIDMGDLGGGTGGMTDNLPAFAGGGSFTVGGSGATDSQLVQFMATPG